VLSNYNVLGQNDCSRDGSACARIPISCRLQQKVDNFTRTANDIVNATIPPVRTLKLYCCPSSGCSTLHSHGRACPCIDQAYACMLHVASPDLYRKCQYFICVYIKYHNHVMSQIPSRYGVLFEIDDYPARQPSDRVTFFPWITNRFLRLHLWL
jgi:hypothetical protein